MLNSDRFKKLSKQMINDKNCLFLGGILALFIGAYVISVHNVWMMNWPVILTLVGCWGLIKGVGILVYSDFVHFFILNKSKRFYQMMGAIYALVGAFLLYEGCFDKLK